MAKAAVLRRASLPSDNAGALRSFLGTVPKRSSPCTTLLKDFVDIARFGVYK